MTEHDIWSETFAARLDAALGQVKLPLTVAARVELSYHKIVAARKAGLTWPRVAEALQNDGEDAIDADNVRIAFGRVQRVQRVPRVQREEMGTGGAFSHVDRHVLAAFIDERDATDRLPQPYRPWRPLL